MMHNSKPYSFEKTEERGKKSLKKLLHITFKALRSGGFGTLQNQYSTAVQ